MACAPVPSVAINTRIAFDLEPCQGVLKNTGLSEARNGRHMACIETVSKRKGLDPVDEIRDDPNPQDPTPGDTNVDGDITHAPTLKTATFWLRWFCNSFREPTGGGPDPWLYTGRIEGGVLQTGCMEKGYIDRNPIDYQVFRGLGLKSFGGDFKSTGLLKWRFGVLGIDADDVSNVEYDDAGGDPVQLAKRRSWQDGDKIHHAMIAAAGMQIGGVDADWVLNGSWNCDRNIVTEDRPVGGGGVLASIPGGKFMASGQVSARYASSDVLDVIQSGDPVSLQLKWRITADYYLLLRWRRVFFEYASPKKSKDGLLDLSTTWHAAYDPTDTSAFHWEVASPYENSVDGDGTSNYEHSTSVTGGILDPAEV